jgi:hypothetical protein
MVACGRANLKSSLGGYVVFKRFVLNGKSPVIKGRGNIADVWAGAWL